MKGTPSSSSYTLTPSLSLGRAEFNWNLQFVHYLRFVENKTYKNNEVYYISNSTRYTGDPACITAAASTDSFKLTFDSREISFYTTN